MRRPPIRRLLAVALAATCAYLSAAPAGSGQSAKENTDCQYAGIRYVGSNALGGTVCFTLTPNGKVLREFAFKYPSKAGCNREVGGFRVAGGEAGIEPVAGGVSVGDNEFKLRLSIRGATASGVFSHVRGACGPGEVRWSARRVAGSPPPVAPKKAGPAIPGRYAGTAAGGQRISFVVSGDGRRVYRLTVVYDPADCRGAGAATRYVPDAVASVRLAADGSFSTMNGIPGGRFLTEVKGKLTGSSAAGTLRIVDEKCDSGRVRWSARRVS